MVVENEPFDAETPVESSTGIGEVAPNSIPTVHDKADSAQRVALSGWDVRQHTELVEESHTGRHHAFTTGLVAWEVGAVQDDHSMSGLRQKPSGRCPGHTAAD